MGRKDKYMNENFMKYIEKRLLVWAEWYLQENFYGIGYPSCSIEYRLMTEGSITKNPYDFKVLPSNSEAEEIEFLVKEMSSFNPKMALSLRYFYFNGGGLREKAKTMEISHMQFKYYVDLARQWLCGRLSGKNKLNAKSTCNVKTCGV
jgi:hypothetical protein